MPDQTPTPTECRWCHGTKRITGCFFESWSCTECEAPISKTELPLGWTLVPSSYVNGTVLVYTPLGLPIALVDDEDGIGAAWAYREHCPPEVLSMLLVEEAKDWMHRNMDVAKNLFAEVNKLRAARGAPLAPCPYSA
jgi:hypothetical protein